MLIIFNIFKFKTNKYCNSKFLINWKSCKNKNGQSCNNNKKKNNNKSFQITYNLLIYQFWFYKIFDDYFFFSY